MTATIKEVAEHCGMDRAIVSQVLKARSVDEDTRRRIVASAEALGFSLPAHSPTLGVLYIDESRRGLTHPFFVLILESFKAEAEAHGYDVNFIHPNAKEEAGGYAEHCHSAGIDGVCMVCVDFRAPEFKELAMDGIPCVTIDHIFKGVPAVLSDNETGVQKLVEYAISKGHRRIAFVHGHNNSIVTKTRISQFYNTMSYNNLPVPEEYVRDGLYNDVPLTRQVVLELLRLPKRPTCILLPDDLTYLGAQDAAREMGLSIPEDISFGGYDGIPLTQALTPRLTTIQQSCEDMGRVAAKRLIDLIENPHSSRKPSIFPVELLEGGTIANLRG